MGDNDAETMNNILHANWDFDSEAFENVSEEAKDFVSRLLVPAKWYATLACPPQLNTIQDVHFTLFAVKRTLSSQLSTWLF